MRLFITVILIISAVACRVRHPNSATKPADLGLSAENAGAAGIIYLTLNVAVTDSLKDEYTFQKVSSRLVPGVLKKAPPVDEVQPDPLFFYCETRDAKNMALGYFRIQNPLMQVFEYSSEEGRLDKAMFKKKSAEFMIRFEISAATKFLVISKKDDKTSRLKPIYNATI